ncbi:MAG: zinc ribbon domain-containing protein [Fimbriimonadaceae bacterium]|nr:zinc ribbon domain-containing protein [Fimbriimonadaceae bacterium]
MPVYEYACRSCGKRVSLLIGMVASPDEEQCPLCGSDRLERLISRFRMGRDEDARMDEMADRLDRMGDPTSHAEGLEMVREIGKAMDEDLSDEMEEMFEADQEAPEPTV